MTELSFQANDLVANTEIHVPHVLNAAGRPHELRVLPATSKDVKPYYEMLTHYTEANGGNVKTDLESMDTILGYMAEGHYFLIGLQTGQGKPVAVHAVELSNLKSALAFNADTSEDGGQQYASLEKAVRRAREAGFAPKNSFMGFNYQGAVEIPQDGSHPDASTMSGLIAVVNHHILPGLIPQNKKYIGSFIETYTGKDAQNDSVARFNGMERKAHIDAGFHTVLMDNTSYHPPALDGSGRVHNLELRGMNLSDSPLAVAAGMAGYLTITYCEGGAGDLVQRAASLKTLKALEPLVRDAA